MEKTKTFKEKKFRPVVIRKAHALIASMAKHSAFTMRIDSGDETTNYDSLTEFFDEYQSAEIEGATLHAMILGDQPRFWLNYSAYSGTTVSIMASDRELVSQMMAPFNEAKPDELFPFESAHRQQLETKIFIGHGRRQDWKKLKDHLQDKHKLEVICYESGARAGHSIRDILEEMVDQSSIAFLILTGEDKTAQKVLRARQNVIHECGLFQGRLGFNRGILVVEQGVELASNFDGIQQIRFKRGNIEAAFGEILATIRREELASKTGQ